MAEAVVNTEQLFNGSLLKVKRLGREKLKHDVEKLKNNEHSREKESTTVEVSGLPVGSTEKNVHIHFQKRKNGGGEVLKVEMLGEEKARVTFENPQGGSKFSRSLFMYYNCKHADD